MSTGATWIKSTKSNLGKLRAPGETARKSNRRNATKQESKQASWETSPSSATSKTSQATDWTNEDISDWQAFVMTSQEVAPGAAIDDFSHMNGSWTLPLPDVINPMPPAHVPVLAYSDTDWQASTTASQNVPWTTSWTEADETVADVMAQTLCGHASYQASSDMAQSLFGVN
ncbi:MAG: hypothetical protein MMC33_003319 [Icmadophila ericetorum]|nr:hypothetical protein [Icmadophila ericetorum]